MSRPQPDEYAEFYRNYVERVPADRDVLDVLREQGKETGALLRSLPDDKADYRYAPGKWSIAEVIGHVTDTERIFSYRAMRFARADETPLPGVDQDDLMVTHPFDGRSLTSLADELEHARAANLALFATFDTKTLERRGLASDVPVSVRALLHIIAGHERHHLDVLAERYLR